MMNRITITALALCSAAALSLTSCLNDDDNTNSGLTAAQVSQCMAAVRGDYTGELYYRATNPDNPEDGIDTCAVSWRVTADTTLIVSSIPADVVKDYIKSNDLKEALAEAQPQPLTAALGFFKTEPVSFFLYPFAVEYPIQYNGGSHKAKLLFWVNDYSLGQYWPAAGAFNIQLMIAALILDDDTSRNYLVDSGSSTVSLVIYISNGKGS